MLKEVALFTVLIVSILALSKDFKCSTNCTYVPLVSKMIAIKSWNVLATINDESYLGIRPIMFSAEDSIQVEARNRFFKAKGNVWDRLTITFKCAENHKIGTFLEITKNYAMFKIKEEPLYRYCVGRKIYHWSKIFTYFSVKEDLLMFYICDQTAEYFMLLATFSNIERVQAGRSQQVYIEKETNTFLAQFNTNLNADNLTYSKHSLNSSTDCENFKNVCLLELENTVDTSFSQDTSKDKFAPSISAWSLAFILTLLLLLMSCVINIYGRIRENNVNDDNPHSVHYTVGSSNVTINY